MIYRTIPPPLMLAPYVRCFWWLEGNGPSYIHRSMADVCPELIFHYKGSFTDLPSGNASFQCGIHGHSGQFSRFSATTPFGIFGVYLYPYALPALLGIPAVDFSNQMPDLASCLGKDSAMLEDSMMLAADNDQRVRIMTDFLVKKLNGKRAGQPGVFEAIHFIIHTQDSFRVGDLPQQYFLSQRQFERNFKSAAGFTPKLFSRIVRFQKALQWYGKPGKPLTDIAYDCGYYDQSHFIHDFKAFSGHHPGHYFSGLAEGTEWRC